MIGTTWRVKPMRQLDFKVDRGQALRPGDGRLHGIVSVYFLCFVGESGQACLIGCCTFSILVEQAVKVYSSLVTLKNFLLRFVKDCHD